MVVVCVVEHVNQKGNQEPNPKINYVYIGYYIFYELLAMFVKQRTMFYITPHYVLHQTPLFGKIE